MPIKPENRALYPPDWPVVRERTLKRAGWRCMHPGCAARQYSVGCWHRPGGGDWKWLALWGDNDNPRTYAEARQVAAEEHFARYGDELTPPGDPKIIVIVLTIAHLNHDPTDNRDANLAAMCQRHHLAHDLDLHRANAQATRRRQAGTLELF